jgi:isocitrate dehydrogenase kinase/phosphatase
MMWVSIKAVYSGLITDRDDWEIAETFFNSVTRQIFTTVGVDTEIEFVHTDFEDPPTRPKQPVYRTYAGFRSTHDLIRAILADSEFSLPASLIEREAALASRHIDQKLSSSEADPIEMRAEVVKSPFYRGEHAYLIGRLIQGSQMTPLVLCLRQDTAGIYLDAVLLAENDVSLLFSFTRSYFHVEVERPYELVRFINSILPRKPVAEIYISIGYNKHGKTELYRHALRHLARTCDKYELARGQRGMVMIVFTMPSYPVVFKIIKDQFDYPKNCTRQSVIDRYRLVFMHDRAGRLVDAQEYQYLELDRHRFADELLDELLHVAAQSVRIAGDRVVIRHCYAERRVVPLNLYLRDADEDAARAAVIDYGNTIKDLAITNIFPGDLMLKNFGVTRHGRLVFYDYDEVSLLSECNIRELPEADDYDEELAAEPWFAVAPEDVFPQEFKHFLGLPPALKDVFVQHHGDLLEVDFWRRIQRRLRAGELFHVAPYGEEKRLPRPSRSWANTLLPVA